MCINPTPFLIFLIFLLLPERIKSRIPTNGFKEMILNGDFKENNPFNTGNYGTNNVTHWSITNNYFEVCYGKTYNSNWDDNKYVIDIDTLSNSIASQQFTIDSNYTCQLKMSYSSSKYANNRDGFNVILNNIEKFRVNPIPNDNINYVNVTITTKIGLNLLEIGALGVSNSYGALLTDISIQCPIFKNYIFFISEGDYELYKDGSLFSYGQVTSTGIYVSLGFSIMTDSLLEIRIISPTLNPRFIATVVYNYDNTEEYIVNTNERWIVDNFHAIELADTDHTMNVNYGVELDISAKWIKSSFSDLKESIFSMAT